MKFSLGTFAGTFGQKPFELDLNDGAFRHLWVIGKSGTGKSTLIRNLAVHIMRQGYGLGMIEPHGDLVYSTIPYITADRLEDMLYLGPDSPRAPDIGLFDHPDKELALQTFTSTIEAKAGLGWGPQTANDLRAVADAVLELCPNPTIIDIRKVFARPKFAEHFLQRSKNPNVQDFYQQYFVDFKPLDRARAFSHPLNKIDELMRPGIIEYLVQKRHLSFKGIMDRQKLFFAPVSKTKMGTRPAKTLGELIVSRFNLSSFQRKKRNRPFFIIIDEVHNFIQGIDFETMLAESRKYGVHYIFATQTLQQMRQPKDNDLIAFGNCSHIFSFRVGAKDAEDIAANFGEPDTNLQLVKLPNYTFKALTMSDGQPQASDPVNLTEYPDFTGREIPARKSLDWAMANTGTPREQIRAQIQEALRN
jgi:hypothetical protein